MGRAGSRNSSVLRRLPVRGGSGCRGRPSPLVGAVGQVAGAVVAVAAFDGGLAITRRYFGFAFAAFRQVVEGGDLPFQRTLRWLLCYFIQVHNQE